ncbi:hypothetical protein [Halorubrum ezzemoulense]|uniref:hypothetical protein n=1 Tax=Halorubrum ezzemoulense TaxID=337243 RepID=UPI0023313528|nr:hypothetical protein [Halorubrum ezzemoulense]MDB2242048.1 hypothetical protein [Halorubrum ezzemoulense]
MNDGSSERRIAFDVDGTTLTVRDVIEGEEMPLIVDREPELCPALPELFPSPVDGAVSFEAESLVIPEYASIVFRDVDGDHVARHNDSIELERGSYCIEVDGVTKVLIRVTDVEIAATGGGGPDPVTISFDRPRSVSVGARSFHERPEATITVPDDPAALTEAVSLLGSSIKEFSPERSWPTLRGYPPRIERGDSLDVPSPLSVPDTGVEVVVRPTYADVYRLSTLSYYLGARMVTGDAPAIRLDTGYEERLPTEGEALEERVTELLRTWFLLDTLVRTEGYVPSDRYEYDAVGPDLPFYPPNLADQSMSERLMEYLEVDAETVAPHLPAWPTEAVLRPVSASAELLPHLAHVLAPVRVRGNAGSSASDAPVGLATSPQASTDPSAFDSSDTSSGPGARSRSDRVPSPDADPIPAGASVISADAYENRLRRPVPERGTLSVAFLFADGDRARSVRESMVEPARLDGIGSLDVTVSPSPDAVAETLSDPALDVVFCGASVTAGITEADGSLRLDGRTEAPNLTVFEGTRTTAAGVDAVERGGAGAIHLGDSVSPERLRTMIGLLTAGSSIGVATQLSLRDRPVTARYVGDPGTAIAVDRGLPTQLYSCRSQATDTYRVGCWSFLSTEVLIGSEYQFTGVFSDRKSVLNGTGVKAGITDASGILDIHSDKSPVLEFPDEIVLWSDDLSADGVAAMARRR